MTPEERKQHLQHGRIAMVQLVAATIALEDDDEAHLAWAARTVEDAYVATTRPVGALWPTIVHHLDEELPEHFTDEERSATVRRRFGDFYPFVAERLPEAALIRAVKAWRTKERHWIAVYELLKSVDDTPPDPESLARMWLRLNGSKNRHDDVPGQSESGVTLDT